jgi:hypothetical protein
MAPVNALRYLRIMFTVEDIDERVSRLSKYGAQLVGEVLQYENAYRLCYMRGIEGILVGLAEDSDIQVHGSGNPVQTLLQHDLADAPDSPSGARHGQQTVC